MNETNKYKKFNHHHEIGEDQEIVDFGTGKFVADKKRIALLKALNECGLITRTHCYGHKTGESFVSIVLDGDMQIRDITERDSTRDDFDGKTELLIEWKRID